MHEAYAGVCEEFVSVEFRGRHRASFVRPIGLVIHHARHVDAALGRAGVSSRCHLLQLCDSRGPFVAGHLLAIGFRSHPRLPHCRANAGKA